MLKLFGFVISLLGVTVVLAGPGDTTRVITHNNVTIKTDPSRGFTNYSGWGQFPAKGTSFSKVYADLTFECAPGLKCGEWDYLNYIFIGKRKGSNNDSLGWEIMRFITPYGNSWHSSQGWKHGWRFDITDFQGLLNDSVEIVYQHTGYEGNTDRGWLINLSMTMIEGTPRMPVLRIDRLYTLNVGYGNDAAFDNAVPEKTFTLEPGTKTVRFKVLQTGHGFNTPENCSEFCAKDRYLVLDGNTINTTKVWRDNCGSNPLYPQAGTWVYDRAGWCPGASVLESNYDHNLIDSNPHTIDLDMESYSNPGGGSNYMITHYLVHYGIVSRQTDATITDILTPSAEYENLRNNPSCGSPEVVIKNEGWRNISSLEFEYGLRGGKKYNHTWTGSLIGGVSKVLLLPGMDDWSKAPGIFDVKILNVNGITDENPLNNTAWSKIPSKIPDVLPQKIIVFFKTNNTPTENSYKIIDAGNTPIFERKNFTKLNTIHRDTFDLYNGCFRFVFDDSGPSPTSDGLNRDGLAWWANANEGSGILQIRDANNGTIKKTFTNDFGTNIVYNFTVGYTLNTKPIRAKTGTIKLFPDPASREIYLDLDDAGIDNSACSNIEIRDLQGRLLQVRNLAPGWSALQVLNIEFLPAGIYTLRFIANNNPLNSRFIVH